MGLPSRKMEVLAELPMPDIINVANRGMQGTVKMLSGRIGLVESNIRRYLQQLHGDGLAYIGCWNQTVGDFAPVWVRGKGKHAPKPDFTPLTSAEWSRNYRARRRIEREMKKKDAELAVKKVEPASSIRTMNMIDIPVFLHQTGFAQPVTLSDENLPGVDRIRNHIIDNPRVSVREIVAALGLSGTVVRNAVFRLNANGAIRRSANKEQDKRVRWESGMDAEYEKREAELGQPKQFTVSTWVPEKRRDYLTAALFGMENVDRRKA